MHIPTTILTVNKASKKTQSYGNIPDIRDILTYDEHYIYCFKQYSSEGIITIYIYSSIKAKGYCIFDREIVINSAPGDVIQITSKTGHVYCSICRKKNQSLYVFSKSWEAVLIAANLDSYATILSAYGSNWIVTNSKFILNISTNVRYECPVIIREMTVFHGIIYYRDETHAYQFNRDGTSELLFVSTTGHIRQLISYNSHSSVAFIMLNQSDLSLSVIDVDHTSHIISSANVVSTLRYESLIYYNVGKLLYVYDHDVGSNTLISKDCISYRFVGTHGQLGYMTPKDIIMYPAGVMYYEVPKINFPIRTYSKLYSDVDIKVE